MGLDIGSNEIKGNLWTDKAVKLLALFYVPLSLLYLELSFHIYLNMQLKYFVIFSLFSLAMGLVLAFIISIFPSKIRFKLSQIIVILMSLVFSVEMIFREVLQQYYQIASGLSVACGNKLAGNSDVILMGVQNNLLGLALMIIPIIIGLIFHNKLNEISKSKGMKKYKYAMIAIIVYLIGVGTLYLPWSGDPTPLKLYKSDTEIASQVEQLGLLTMLELDIRHRIFGVEREYDFNFDYQNNDEVEDVIIEDNVLNIDFSAMKDNTDNETQKWLSDYYISCKPTQKNEYTGMFKGFNVVYFCLEGFDGAMIDEELTPTLYKMKNEGFAFDNFYTPLHFTSTSGGEFRNLTGLYPKNGFPISMMEIGKRELTMPFNLAEQLKKDGYITKGYHANENMYGRSFSHSQLGYDWKQKGSGFVMEIDSKGKMYWPQSDEYAVMQTIDEYINEEPFHVYYLSMSGHLPYVEGANSMTKRNKEIIENSKYKDYSEVTKGYLAANLEVEKAMVYLNDRLEDAGVDEETVIVMVPDHIPYFNISVLEELTGKDYGTDSLESINEGNIDFDVYRNSLVIWSAGMKEAVKVDRYCSQVDVLPTLSNLLGLDFDSRLMAGKDILSNGENIVILASKSWITDEGTYNKTTEKFQPSESCTMDENETIKYVEKINFAVSNRIDSSVYVIENDYYSTLIYK